MDVRKLAQFLAIIEAGSLSRAAARLNIAQPALTHAVQSLEEELGVPLLERHARGIAVTEFGSVLADHAQQILKEIGRAKENIRERLLNPSGKVRLSLPSVLSGGVAVSLLAGFKTGPETAELEVLLADARASRAAVVSGEIDFALTYGSDADVEVTLRPLVVEELGIGLPRGSNLGGRRLSIIDVEALRLVLLPKGDPIRAVIDEAAARRGVKLAIAAELGALGDLLAATGQGYSTILPRYAIRRAVELGIIAGASLVDPRIPCCLFLMTSRGGRSLSRVGAVAYDRLINTIETLVHHETWPGRYVGHMESSASLISIYTNTG